MIEEEVPQWIDWSAYDETARNFMTLFSKKTGDTGFNKKNATNNYKQVQAAFGWDGSSFAELKSGKFDGTKVLFRVKDEPDEQYGPTTVGWVDHFDASPTFELKSVDDAVLKSLEDQLQIEKPKATTVVAAAAPATKKTKTKKPPKAKTSPKVAPPVAETPAAPAPPVVAPSPATELAPEGTDCTKEEAWNDSYTKAAAIDTDPSVITDAFITAIAEVSADNGDIDESAFTPANWGKVRSITLSDLGA